MKAKRGPCTMTMPGQFSSTTRTKVLVLLVSAIVVFPLALSAQETPPANASSGRSPAAPSAEPKYITQSNTYPDGTHHITKLLVEGKMEWNKEYQGFVIPLRAMEKDPGLVLLDPSGVYKALLHESTDSALPTKIVKSLDQLPAIDFHTDITAIRAFSVGDSSALEFYGKVSMCLMPDFASPDGKSKLFPLAGTPGTRIDLSPLFSLKEQVKLLGRYWRPTKDNGAILVVTTNAIDALNLEVSEAKTNAP